MDLGLRNKAVFIRGDGKGIGSAIAGGRAQDGALPIEVDKVARADEQFERELRDAGFTVRFRPWVSSSRRTAARWLSRPCRLADGLTLAEQR
jgi:hypothetical protein